jgi:hypothetical protein
VKTISKTWLLLSCLSLPLATEAKQIEQLINAEITLDNSVNKTTLKSNLENLLPVSQSLYTADKLSKQVAKTDYPLQALYQIWAQAVTISDTDTDTNCDPFYILNFKGYSNLEAYTKGFINLCDQLKIDVRAVSTQGKEYYDFCHDGKQWEFLDIFSNQFYLALDNQTLASSEEIIDDPFLAIRTKANRQDDKVDFIETWKNLAYFEIIDSYLGEEIRAAPASSDFPKDFDFYQGEELQASGLHSNQILVEHALAPSLRGNQINYSSPFPIKEVYNATSKAVNINSSILQPGETFTLPDATTFTLEIYCEEANGSIRVFSVCSAKLFSELSKNTIDSPVKITNQQTIFDHCTPFFNLAADQTVDKIKWQISSSPDFALIPSNFEQTQAYSDTVTLPLITDTFFSTDQNYYFRVKALVDGQWSEWTDSFAFSVVKPEAVTEIDFNILDKNSYEISWEASSEKAEYLIFASNSLDFLPSIYWDRQINAIVDGNVVEEERNDNLQLVTQANSVVVDGSFAYYRIIAKENNQFSVPSRLIHVYDQDLYQPRNVLQVAEMREGHTIIKRSPLHCDEINDGLVNKQTAWENGPLASFMLKTLDSTNLAPFKRSPHVSEEIWTIVKPHLLPANHPARAKLDRLFSSRRVIRSPNTFKEAGFTRYRPGRFSRIMASGHPHLKGYFIKAFADTELTITADWMKLMHRIEGAKSIRACIKKHGYEKKFTVPHKWLYPLPAEPSPPHSAHYLRKNFILVAEDMRIYDHEKNNKYYKKKMTPELIKALFTIIDEEGLADSLYAFNVPFCRDGRLAFIDTEHHHRWPIKYEKFKKYFSSDMGRYWDSLVKNRSSKH